MSRLHAELVALFGRGVLDQARLFDPADIDLTAAQMDRVRNAADELLRQSGNTRTQVALVRDLDSETRLVLCMWAIDTKLMDSLLRRATAPINADVEVSR